MSDPTPNQRVYRTPHKGFVYLIGVREAPNYFKIGQTFDLQNRLQGLNGGTFQTLYLVWSLATNYPREAERALHRQFKSKRFKNEWFKLESEDIDKIRALTESDLVRHEAIQEQSIVASTQNQTVDEEDVIDTEEIYDFKKLWLTYQNEHYSGIPRHANPMLQVEIAIAHYKELGFSDDWLIVKLQIQLQKLYPKSIFQYYVQDDWQYDSLLEELRLGLWKRTTAAIRSQMGLKKSDNLRDHQTTLALSYELLAENMSAYELERQQQLEFDEAKQVVRASSEFVGKQAEEAGKRLGVDIATNKPLLPDGK